MTQDLTLTMTVNGREVTRTGGAHLTLLRWLRDLASVVDPKYGCGEGVCGACAVLVDDEPVNACLVLAAQANGTAITTAVGLSEEDGSLSSLQRAFLEHGAAQCGFCTPGMLMAATELIGRGGPLDRNAIREELHGNICRCTGYQAIVDAIYAAALEMAR